MNNGKTVFFTAFKVLYIPVPNSELCTVWILIFIQL